MIQNKVVVITGGGGGIGRSMSLLFARHGIDVAVAGRTLDKLQATVAEIKAQGGKGLAIQADVSIPADVDRIFDQTMETFGRVDILVNNAGATHPALSIIDLDLSYMDEVINTDFKGVYLCSRRAGREMIRQKGGCVINIASMTALVSLPFVLQGPMKSAVVKLTTILAREWARHKVRVNSIAPGYVMTPGLKELIDKGERDPSLILERVPMHAFIEPEDVAQAALFLSSDEARYITGINLTVDAGWTSDGGWAAYPIGQES